MDKEKSFWDQIIEMQNGIIDDLKEADRKVKYFTAKILYSVQQMKQKAELN